MPSPLEGVLFGEDSNIVAEAVPRKDDVNSITRGSTECPIFASANEVEALDSVEFDDFIVSDLLDHRDSRLSTSVVTSSSKRRKVNESNAWVTSESATPQVVPEFSEICEPLYDTDGVRVGEVLPDHITTILPNRIRVDVPETTLVSPESRYEGFVPPAPHLSEEKASNALLKKLDEDAGAKNSTSESEGEFLEILLEDFSVYNDSTWSGEEMRPLQYLNAKQTRYARLLFDGVLKVGDARYFVERVPFEELSVGNYGVENHSVDGQIWIRSLSNARAGNNVYYRLGQPARCYARFFSDFVWIANFAKYFVDYLEALHQDGKRASIYDFRKNFFTWTSRKHSRLLAFKQWFSVYGKQDFRVAVSVNVEFLYKETCGVLSQKVALSQRVFREVLTFTEYKPVGSIPTKRAMETPPSVSPETTDPNNADVPPTIVTPYIAHCFSHLPCGPVMKAVDLDPTVEKLRASVTDGVGLELIRRAMEDGESKGPPPTQAPLSEGQRERMLESIKPGDTISIKPDHPSLSKWAEEAPHGVNKADNRWFGLVQSIERSRRGNRLFQIIWYYRPLDTICSVQKYPVPNELFLSNHCTCSEGLEIDQDDVLGVHKVGFYPALESNAEFLCRQSYDMEERRFTTFKDGDKLCACQKEGKEGAELERFSENYRRGDTVLVELKRGDTQLEPCEVVGIDQDTGQHVQLRRLFRRSVVDPTAKNARPNELVYSEETVGKRFSSVKGKCFVRVVDAGKPIPVPYNRDGVGLLFYMTHELRDGACWPLDSPPPSLRQSFAPNTPRPNARGKRVKGEKSKKKMKKRLMGLDLFCGSGNLGRGLEEGGAVEMRWANDISEKAIHTYMANAPEPSRVTPFLGSIDALQERAIRGQFSNAVPKVGDVGCISGGSPCPGFSRLTNDKTTPMQRKNQSLVAAFASMIDVYRPRYGILENVVGIVQKRELKHEDVFSQLVCAIVGMGYQVQMLFLDAWSYGSCQSRSRVFLVFAAPGEFLPAIPVPSHSHPPHVRNAGLGSLGNGEKMTTREFHDAYAFKYCSAEEATADLPYLYDGKTDYCIPAPDHVPSATMTKLMRAQVRCIPRFPTGMGFSSTWNNGHGRMTPPERALFPTAGVKRVTKSSLAWTRCRPARLFPTVTTAQCPVDFKTGGQIHWAAERFLTLQESRRAQGFPDDEVLLGCTRDRWKAVGNSVAREVSLVLGLSFRGALWGMSEDDDDRGEVGGIDTPTTCESKSLQMIAALNGLVVAEQKRGLAWPYVSPASIPATRSCSRDVKKVHVPIGLRGEDDDVLML